MRPGSNHLLPLAPRVDRYSRAQPSKADAGPRKSMCRGSSWASSCSRRCVPLPRGVRPAAAGTAVRHTSPPTSNSIFRTASDEASDDCWPHIWHAPQVQLYVRKCGSAEVQKCGSYLEGVVRQCGSAACGKNCECRMLTFTPQLHACIKICVRMRKFLFYCSKPM